MLGWLMIGLVFLLVAFNSGLIFCELMNFIRVLYLRIKNRAPMERLRKRMNNKVLPAAER